MQRGQFNSNSNLLLKTWFVSLFLQNRGSWQDSSDCPPPKPTEQNVHVDRFYDFSQASGTPSRPHILFLYAYLSMFSLISIWDFISVFFPAFPKFPSIGLCLFFDTFPRYHQVEKIPYDFEMESVEKFWILIPCSMRNFWSLNKTCVWVPFCLLLSAFLVLGLGRLCYMEHAIELISGTV